MAEDTPNPRRINVSEDTLRAALAEMELRLRIYFDDQLKHKADGASVIELQLAMDKLERGEFTDAQKRSIDSRIEGRIDGRKDKRWTRSDQVAAVCSMAAAIGMLVLTIVLALHGIIL